MDSLVHIRPRFHFTRPEQAESIIDRIRRAIDKAPDHIAGKITDSHITIDIVGPDQHFWSPHLDFRVEDDPHQEGQTIIAGLIGPRPTVWTMFMFFYFIMALIGFVMSSYAISKWMMDESSPLIWAFPISLIVMASAYFAGKSGEKLGADQIEDLKDFVRHALNDPID